MAPKKQHKTEETFYREVIGIQGEFLFAENIEEARLLVVSGRGFLPIEGEVQASVGDSLCHLLLLRNGSLIHRKYGVFWKREHTNESIEEFATLLKAQFS